MAPRRNKVKPFDPAAAERARISQRRTDFDAVGLQPEAATLESYADVQTTRAGEMRGAKRVDGDTARRLDVFETLRGIQNREEISRYYRDFNLVDADDVMGVTWALELDHPDR